MLTKRYPIWNWIKTRCASVILYIFIHFPLLLALQLRARPSASYSNSSLRWCSVSFFAYSRFWPPIRDSCILSKRPSSSVSFFPTLHHIDCTVAEGVAIMENSFLYTPEEVLEHFNVSEQTGLSQDAVLKSRQKHGSNGQYTPPALPESGAETNQNCSSARGPSLPSMETGAGTVQRPTGRHSLRLRRSLFCAGAV